MGGGRRIIVLGSALLGIFAALGCDLDEVEAQTFRRDGGIWIGNGLEDLDVSGVDPAHGLSTTHGLDPDGTSLLDDGIRTATYLVECALAADQSITKTRTADGQTFVLEGRLGLAPEWEDEECDEDCQQWVTACLLARTNVTGESVALWLSADHPAIGLGHGVEYPLHEATFYGNLFQDPAGRHLCRGIDVAASSGLGEYLDGRTCGGVGPEACGFTQWGGCNDVGRCITAAGHATECATGGDPLTGVRHRSISTFVAADAWQ
jgi:hypothetical protein